MTALSTRPAAVTMNVRQRTRGLLSPLNLHFAGVGLLGLICLYMLIHMAFAYRAVSSRDADALAAEQVQLKAAQIAAKPLNGLDAKLKNASLAADAFSVERLPASWSEVLTELGGLAHKDNVHLSAVQYGQSAVDGDSAGQLTQVTMDASLSGDYRGLVLFINGLERDKVFFLISGITLSGQQTGVVNLKIRIVTYLRGLGPNDLPPASTSVASVTSADATAGAVSSATPAAAGGAR